MHHERTMMPVARRVIFSSLLAFLAIATLSGEVTFRNPELSMENVLLFAARTSSPGSDTYDTLFATDLDDRILGQLTFYPERVMLTGNGRQYQIQNRYGVFRTDGDLSGMHVVEAFPSFVKGAGVSNGKINQAIASPDGTYLLYLEPISWGYANLIAFHTGTSEKVIVTEKIEFTLDGPPAVWSPDSGFFVYSKQGSIYYYSIDQLRDGRIISEEFRSIGSGGIANVRWARNGDLYLLSGSLVYRIKSVEFFTRSLYTKLLSIGNVAGKIPFSFDPSFDEFWISPDGYKILLGKGGRNIFLFYLQPDDYLSTGATQSLPYLFLPRNTQVKQVLWSTGDRIVLLTGSITGGATTTSIFELELDPDATSYAFVKSAETGVLDLVLSQDETKVAVLKEGEVAIRELSSWQDVATFAHPEPLSVIWYSDTRIIIAGAWMSEIVDVGSGTSRVLALSQPGRYGFSSEAEELIVIGSGDTNYLAEAGVISESDTVTIRDPQVASSDFRVYLDRNNIMVRNISGFGTEELFSFPEPVYDPFPAEGAAVSFTNFSHGSRIRRREVSLVFNAIDTVEGLTEVLNVLSEYDLACTFFVNGEFIRRHPGAVREIAESGHEVGSLFYAYFNMTDASFKIDKNFIKQGLARNEDDYFSITGRELSLLWHAPYYFTNSEIIEASREMNYTYVGRDIDPLDWVSKGEPTLRAFYLPAADLIERVMKLKQPGSIIPVRIGRTEPGRDDYLFHHLGTLINGLVDQGYDLVPVSTLIEHAK
jgi:peptidoglycan/xylan/chitin deacetylase (PgdA/CDA1 family)